MEKAKEYLKQKGLVQAQKRLDKEAKEGIIGIVCSPKNDFVAITEINCETDFVAKTDEFLTFSSGLLKKVVQD
jgi:elongation factor Ts